MKKPPECGKKGLFPHWGLLNGVDFLVEVLDLHLDDGVCMSESKLTFFALPLLPQSPFF